MRRVSLILSGTRPQQTKWTISLVCKKALGGDIPLKLSIVFELSKPPRRLKYFMGQWKRVVSPNAQRAIVFPLQLLHLLARYRVAHRPCDAPAVKVGA
jgi:hypothetical protein